MAGGSRKEESVREKLLVQKLAQQMGENVRSLRISQNLTQERLAFMIGTQHPRISDIERGLVVARLSDIVKLAGALNVRLEDIIDLSAFDPSDYCAASPIEYVSADHSGPVGHARL